MKKIRIQNLASESYERFGWVLGTEPVAGQRDYHESEEFVTWHEHDIEVGEGGKIEFSWTHKKRRDFSVLGIESHRLTEQIFIPINGAPMIHVVCPPPDDPMEDDIRPDLEQIAAFLLDGSKGICMKRGCWHWNLPLVEGATYLMVSRRSTTLDLRRAARTGKKPTETVIWEISDLTDTAIQLVL